MNTKPVERLEIPSIMLTDGPHGLRKQKGEADHIGLNESVKATCFPSAAATACSWDRELMGEIGQALAEECLHENVAVILGPGANIKRSPLCGRNFEYISEDPYLTGEIAASLITGVQSKGIGTSLKHYALNNQETRRMSIDAVVDERAQREIYLAGFESAVKKAQPWTVMCSYNREGGTYLSENKRLLSDILKSEWGHEGLVMTDWGAINDRVEGVKAGLELEMPSSNGKNDEKIIKAVKEGTLKAEDLDRPVKRLIELALKGKASEKKDFKYNIEKHRKLARKAAQDSSVLLKNEGILPLAKDKKIAVIGEFAKKPRYQGAGSSKINPHKVDNALEEFEEKGVNYEYARGYDVCSQEPKPELIAEAKRVAENADIAVIFAGLTDDFESEGFDRKHMSLPQSHNELIKEVAKTNGNIVIVLQNGAPVEMPWINEAKGILECYLGGEAGSSAAVDLLFGDANPSGKLAETFPIKLADTPCYNYFPGNQLTVEHRESIYVGYRYYDKVKKEALFPFGHGLSYTQFEYSGLNVKKLGELDFEAEVKVKNIGDRAGAEIVQLYIRNNDSPIFKAEKELKAFEKVFLQPSEEKLIVFNLDKRSFAYYNTQISNWHADDGIYAILIGSSSKDIRLEKDINIETDDDVTVPDLIKTLPAYYFLNKGTLEIDDGQFTALLGRKIPKAKRNKKNPYDASVLLSDIQDKLIGKLLNWLLSISIKKQFSSDNEEDKAHLDFMEAIIKELPIKSIGMMAGEALPKYFTDGYIDMLNGKFFRGLATLFKKK